MDPMNCFAHLLLETCDNSVDKLRRSLPLLTPTAKYRCHKRAPFILRYSNIINRNNLQLIVGLLSSRYQHQRSGFCCPGSHPMDREKMRPVHFNALMMMLRWQKWHLTSKSLHHLFPKLISSSLTSLFSTNMAISETKGQGWRAIPTQ